MIDHSFLTFSIIYAKLLKRKNGSVARNVIFWCQMLINK